MKRAAPSRRFSLIPLTLLLVAGVAWGAVVRPHPGRTHVAATARPVRTKPATPQTPATVAKSRVARVASTARRAPVAGEAGMRIFKDPETGEIGPPTAANAAIIAAESKPAVDVTSIPQVKLANGGWELLLDGKVEDAVVVQIDAKGNRVMRCVNDPKTALKQAPVQAPASQREDR